MQKIIPFLWFDGKAQEAAKYYVSIFKNSSITHTDPMSTTFQLDGQDFYALNGGPQFKFTEAISPTGADMQRKDEAWCICAKLTQLQHRYTTHNINAAYLR